MNTSSPSSSLLWDGLVWYGSKVGENGNGNGQLRLKLSKLPDSQCTKIFLGWNSTDNLSLQLMTVSKLEAMKMKILQDFFGDITAVKTRVDFNGTKAEMLIKRLHLEQHPVGLGFVFGENARPICIYFDHSVDHYVGIVQSIGSTAECHQKIVQMFKEVEQSESGSEIEEEHESVRAPPSVITLDDFQPPMTPAVSPPRHEEDQSDLITEIPVTPWVPNQVELENEACANQETSSSNAQLPCTSTANQVIRVTHAPVATSHSLPFIANSVSSTRSNLVDQDGFTMPRRNQQLFSQQQQTPARYRNPPPAYNNQMLPQQQQQQQQQPQPSSNYRFQRNQGQFVTNTLPNAHSNVSMNNPMNNDWPCSQGQPFSLGYQAPMSAYSAQSHASGSRLGTFPVSQQSGQLFSQQQITGSYRTPLLRQQLVNAPLLRQQLVNAPLAPRIPFSSSQLPNQQQQQQLAFLQMQRAASRPVLTNQFPQAQRLQQPHQPNQQQSIPQVQSRQQPYQQQVSEQEQSTLHQVQTVAGNRNQQLQTQPQVQPFLQQQQQSALHQVQTVPGSQNRQPQAQPQVPQGQRLVQRMALQPNIGSAQGIFVQSNIQSRPNIQYRPIQPRPIQPRPNIQAPVPVSNQRLSQQQQSSNIPPNLNDLIKEVGSRMESLREMVERAGLQKDDYEDLKKLLRNIFLYVDSSRRRQNGKGLQDFLQVFDHLHAGFSQSLKAPSQDCTPEQLLRSLFEELSRFVMTFLVPDLPATVAKAMENRDTSQGISSTLSSSAPLASLVTTNSGHSSEPTVFNSNPSISTSNTSITSCTVTSSTLLATDTSTSISSTIDSSALAGRTSAAASKSPARSDASSSPRESLSPSSSVSVKNKVSSLFKNILGRKSTEKELEESGKNATPTPSPPKEQTLNVTQANSTSAGNSTRRDSEEIEIIKDLSFPKAEKQMKQSDPNVEAMIDSDEIEIVKEVSSFSQGRNQDMCTSIFNGVVEKFEEKGGIKRVYLRTLLGGLGAKEIKSAEFIDTVFKQLESNPSSFDLKTSKDLFAENELFVRQLVDRYLLRNDQVNEALTRRDSKELDTPLPTYVPVSGLTSMASSLPPANLHKLPLNVPKQIKGPIKRPKANPPVPKWKYSLIIRHQDILKVTNPFQKQLSFNIMILEHSEFNTVYYALTNVPWPKEMPVDNSVIAEGWDSHIELRKSESEKKVEKIKLMPTNSWDDFRLYVLNWEGNALNSTFVGEKEFKNWTQLYEEQFLRSLIPLDSLAKLMKGKWLRFLNLVWLGELVRPNNTHFQKLLFFKCEIENAVVRYTVIVTSTNVFFCPNEKFIKNVNQNFMFGDHVELRTMMNESIESRNEHPSILKLCLMDKLSKTIYVIRAMLVGEHNCHKIADHMKRGESMAFVRGDKFLRVAEKLPRHKAFPYKTSLPFRMNRPIEAIARANIGFSDICLEVYLIYLNQYNKDESAEKILIQKEKPEAEGREIDLLVIPYNLNDFRAKFGNLGYEKRIYLTNVTGNGWKVGNSHAGSHLFIRGSKSAPSKINNVIDDLRNSRLFLSSLAAFADTLQSPGKLHERKPRFKNWKPLLNDFKKSFGDFHPNSYNEDNFVDYPLSPNLINFHASPRRSPASFVPAGSSSYKSNVIVGDGANPQVGNQTIPRDSTAGESPAATSNIKTSEMSREKTKTITEHPILQSLNSENDATKDQMEKSSVAKPTQQKLTPLKNQSEKHRIKEEPKSARHAKSKRMTASSASSPFLPPDIDSSPKTPMVQVHDNLSDREEENVEKTKVVPDMGTIEIVLAGQSTESDSDEDEDDPQKHHKEVESRDPSANADNDQMETDLGNEDNPPEIAGTFEAEVDEEELLIDLNEDAPDNVDKTSVSVSNKEVEQQNEEEPKKMNETQPPLISSFTSSLLNVKLTVDVKGEEIKMAKEALYAMYKEKGAMTLHQALTQGCPDERMGGNVNNNICPEFQPTPKIPDPVFECHRCASIFQSNQDRENHLYFSLTCTSESMRKKPKFSGNVSDRDVLAFLGLIDNNNKTVEKEFQMKRKTAKKYGSSSMATPPMSEKSSESQSFSLTAAKTSENCKPKGTKTSGDEPTLSASPSAASSEGKENVSPLSPTSRLSESSRHSQKTEPLEEASRPDPEYSEISDTEINDDEITQEIQSLQSPKLVSRNFSPISEEGELLGDITGLEPISDGSLGIISQSEDNSRPAVTNPDQSDRPMEDSAPNADVQDSDDNLDSALEVTQQRDELEIKTAEANNLQEPFCTASPLYDDQSSKTIPVHYCVNCNRVFLSLVEATSHAVITGHLDWEVLRIPSNFRSDYKIFRRPRVVNLDPEKKAFKKNKANLAVGKLVKCKSCRFSTRDIGDLLTHLQTTKHSQKKKLKTQATHQNK